MFIGMRSMSGMKFGQVLALAAAFFITASAPAAAAPHADGELHSVSMSIAAPASNPEVIANFRELDEPADVVPAFLLDWSAVPGVYESDLSRRSGNSLYLESRRQIAESELLEAKRRDASRLWESLEAFIDLLLDKNRMSRFELASQMGDALLRIDEATWNALRVGGQAYELAASIQKLRTWLLNEWQVSSDADPGVKALLDAEARIPTVETNSSAIRFLALIQAADADEAEAPIRTHEFGVALMSEEPETIRRVYEALRGDLKRKLELQLTVLLEEIDREQIELDQRDQKITEIIDLLGLEAAAPIPRDRASSR